jgi:hypothetical protein
VIAGLSVIGVTLGTFIACIADRHPRLKKHLETLAGFLLIAGFALLGYGLEVIFGQP